MKKIGVLFGILIIFSMFSFSFITAKTCDLSVAMINQDPYPAIQGEEAKIVFQIDGVSNPECKTVSFGLIEKYPITISPGSEKSYLIDSGTFIKDYKSFLLAPFKVKIASDAIDGDNIIEVKYRGGGNNGYETKQFNLNIKDTRATFEVYVKDYDAVNRKITFEILNTAENNIEALAIEIPKQNNILIKGTNREIVGDLDSNEYTTADFEAIPSDGNLKIILKYSDENHERRISEVNVKYDGNYFIGQLKDEKKSSVGSYIKFIVIIFIIIWLRIRYKKKKKNIKSRV